MKKWVMLALIVMSAGLSGCKFFDKLLGVNDNDGPTTPISYTQQTISGNIPHGKMVQLPVPDVGIESVLIAPQSNPSMFTSAGYSYSGGDSLRINSGEVGDAYEITYRVRN